MLRAPGFPRGPVHPGPREPPHIVCAWQAGNAEGRSHLRPRTGCSKSTTNSPELSTRPRPGSATHFGRSRPSGGLISVVTLPDPLTIGRSRSLMCLKAPAHLEFEGANAGSAASALKIGEARFGTSGYVRTGVAGGERCSLQA